MASWGIAELKAKASEVVESAQTNRTPAHNSRTMSEFFRSSPLVGSGIDLRRSRSKVK